MISVRERLAKPRDKKLSAKLNFPKPQKRKQNVKPSLRASARIQKQRSKKQSNFTPMLVLQVLLSIKNLWNV